MTVPRYLVTHPQAQHREDMLIEGDDVRLSFAGGWAVFTDIDGVCLAIPTARDATIQRVDEEQNNATT